MRVLIVYRHYWPDLQPLGTMLKTLAEHLAARGHRVTVFTAEPADQPSGTTRAAAGRSFVGGVRVIRIRLPLRRAGRLAGAVNWTTFLAHAFAYAARHRFHLVWTTALPPVVSGQIGLACARFAGARFLYHVETVQPEARIVSGSMKEGWLARIAATVDSWTCRAADAVVVQSDDMTRTIADRGGNGAVAFHDLPSFVLPGLRSGEPPEPREEEGFRLVYLGHLGRFQRLERLLEAMALIPPSEGITLEIVGTGGAEKRLKRYARAKDLTHVRFTVPTSAAEGFRLARGADAGVVSLAPGAHRVTFPSKLMTYLAAGLPVLALVEPASALGRYLAEKKAGIALGGDAAATAAAIRQMRDDRVGGAGRARLRALAEADFGRDHACAAWTDLVESFSPE